MLKKPCMRTGRAILWMTVLAVAGCQSGSGPSESSASTSVPPDPLTTVSRTAPTDFAAFSYASAIEDDPRPLSGSEIEALYAGVAEAFDDLDQPGIRVASTYTANGAVRYAWSFRGEVREGSGRWYVRNDQLCIDYDAEPPTPETPDPFCRTMVGVSGAGSRILGSLNADGYVGGAHRLEPLP